MSWLKFYLGFLMLILIFTLVLQKSEEAHSQFPPRASVKKDSSGDKDFGVPSLSQATDR